MTIVTATRVVLPKTPGSGVYVDEATPTWGWCDIIGNAIPKAVGVGSPARAVYIGAAVGQYAFAEDDVCDFQFHIPHDYVPGTDVYFHVHWSHNGTTVTGDAVFDVYYTYAKGHDQMDFVTEKNLTITHDTVDITTTPQYRHRIDEAIMTGESATASLFDRDTLEPDGLILATLKLSTLPTLGGGGKLFVHMCGIHYQSSSLGTKQKAPDFYV